MRPIPEVVEGPRCLGDEGFFFFLRGEAPRPLLLRPPCVRLAFLLESRFVGRLECSPPPSQ